MPCAPQPVPYASCHAPCTSCHALYASCHALCTLLTLYPLPSALCALWSDYSFRYPRTRDVPVHASLCMTVTNLPPTASSPAMQGDVRQYAGDSILRWAAHSSTGQCTALLRCMGELTISLLSTKQAMCSADIPLSSYAEVHMNKTKSSHNSLINLPGLR